MNKKIFLIIVIFLVGIFMPKVVFAEDTELEIRVGEDYYNILAGEIPEGVTYDETTNTLTLNNFEGKDLIGYGMDLTIVLKGENNFLEAPDFAVAVEAGTLTIKGDGTLNIDCEDEGLGAVGKLVIDSGTINIKNGDVGVWVLGDFEINGGELNIEDCMIGIMQDNSELDILEEMGYSKKLQFLANGGKINISGTQVGISLGGTFKLNGTDIVIQNCRVGLTALEERNAIVDGYIEFNKGSLVFKDITGEGSMAMAIGYLLDEIAEEDLVKFNSNNLYIEDEKYGFVTAHDDKYTFLVLAEEGISLENEEDYKKLALDVSILPKKTYKVTEGNGQKIYQKADSIKIDADLDKFVALYINDELVDEANYELESGSTIIKLKEDYTKKLSAGNYKFKVVFTDGVAEGEFTVITDNPETGDNIIVSIILLAISILGIVAAKKLSKSM